MLSSQAGGDVIAAGISRARPTRRPRRAMGPPSGTASAPTSNWPRTEVMGALRKVWAVMDAPAGKRMAPFLPEITAARMRKR